MKENERRAECLKNLRNLVSLRHLQNLSLLKKPEESGNFTNL